LRRPPFVAPRGADVTMICCGWQSSVEGSSACVEKWMIR
jgi:hypothetical protein